jgi:hypothetical protein
MTLRPTEQNPIKKGGVRKEVTEAKREDLVGCVTQFNTAMVVLIHGSIYGNPVADQRTHRGRDGKAALIFSFIWIKNLSWKLNVILHLPYAGGTVERYVCTASHCSTCRRSWASDGDICFSRWTVRCLSGIYTQLVRAEQYLLLCQ